MSGDDIYTVSVPEQINELLFDELPSPTSEQVNGGLASVNSDSSDYLSAGEEKNIEVNEATELQSDDDWSSVSSSSEKEPGKAKKREKNKKSHKAKKKNLKYDPRFTAVGVLYEKLLPKDQLVVKIVDGPLLGKRFAFPIRYISDPTTPFIVGGTVFQLVLLPDKNKQKSRSVIHFRPLYIVLEARVWDYVKVTSHDICYAFNGLGKDMPHEEVVEKLYSSWRQFLTFILNNSLQYDQGTLTLILEKILPAEKSVFTENKSHHRRFQDIIYLFSSRNSNFLLRLGQIDFTNDTKLVKLIKQLIEFVVVTTKSFDSVHHLLRPLRRCDCEDSEELLGLIEGCCKGYDPLLKSLASQDFRDIPLIPIKEELKGCIMSLLKECDKDDPLTRTLLQLESHLSPNRVDGPWVSAEEFLNVHFRLLREECFASIRERIASIRIEGASTDNPQVHRDVKVIAYSVAEGTIVIKIGFKSHRHRTNLMYGNLLCIDVNTDFSNPIWATVKDSEKRSKSIDIIVVGIGNQYASSDPEKVTESSLSPDLLLSGLQRLIACQSGVMVESPTYYHAFRLVLARLQSMSESDFPFASEILLKSIEPQVSTVDFSRNSKEALKSQSSLLQVILRDYTNTIQAEAPSKKNFLVNKAMDVSQKEAAENAFSNRFSLIQGPPGCGKTFVGKEIVGTMLETWNLNRPILIMTYKNHALDSFLEHCLKFPNSLVRIGGRSTSDKIAEFNLQKKCRSDESKIYFSLEEYKKLQEARAQLQGFASQVENSAEKYLTGITAEDLYLFLLYEHGKIGQQQICSLLYKNFKKNYNRIIRQKVKFSSPEEVKKAVEDILSCNQNVSRKLFKMALKQWLSESDLQNFLPRQQHPLLIENKDETKKKVNSKKDEIEETDEEEEEWDEIYGERCLGNESNLDFVYIPEEKVRMYGELQKYVGDAEPDERELRISNIDDVWRLTDEGRYLLLSSWIRKCRDPEKPLEALKQYNRYYQEVKELEEKRNVAFLKSRKILGATITGCCLKLGTISRVAPTVVVVEEAAEILESQLVAALPSSVKHLILIGDHKQLPPQVHHYRLRVEYKLGVSIFERLANNGFPVSQLQFHRRGPKSLCPLFSRFYEQEINASKEDPRPPAILVNLGLMYWWTHEKPAQISSIGSSYENEFEATMLVGTVRLMIQLGRINASRISIITGYLGQTKMIKKMLAKHEVEGVSVCTIDRYQGDENDFIFLSLTRSVNEKSDKQPTLGFLASPNRACVALSRAKIGLYIFGCSTLFETHKTWRDTVEYFKEKEKLGRRLRFFKNKLPFEHPQDFAVFFKRLEMRKKEFKLKMNNRFMAELPKEALEGIHDVTKEFGKKMESLMNGSVLDVRDLGQGRDADGKRFNRFKVTNVKRIYWKDQYLMYLHHRELVEAEQPPPLEFEVDSMVDWMVPMLNKKANEFFLFHGTNQGVADIISKTGFDERLANLRGMYGAGTYFAENADKSDQYTSGSVRLMFLA